ncbi:hypothetical protein PJF56_16210 [Roseofilum sp. BLCC_M91]|uniref:Uncharacterized protein n=1 Tax=Roseofilum halophilum BLCC-M91 TaxID=3022259 RepID=A0ABT7BMI7_9CYAN|nr:hypothetical protein [Roseofilum halophilum]MDJ1180407.1 hypothetical protein [Roseofilum halophilum BLCC-M91]
MATITLEVPDELVPHLNALGDRLPTVLQQCLQAPLPNHIYHYILNFLASRPTPEEIADFRPTPEMCDRLQTLLQRSKAETLTPEEQAELDEYERIEHLIVMLKAGNFSHLTAST